MIIYSKMTDQNISHFIIFVSNSRIKYIDNLKWLIFWLVIFYWMIITIGDE
jgi:hypothetical protein